MRIAAVALVGMAVVVGCGGSSPEVVTSGRAAPDRPLEQRGEQLGLTTELPQAVLDVCRDASSRSGAMVVCPPLVPEGSKGRVHAEKDSDTYVLDFDAANLPRDDGGHWTFTANPPQWLRDLVSANVRNDDVNPQSVTIAGVEAQMLRVPSATGGLYGNHVVLVWESDDFGGHISSHGFASLPRLRLMAEAVIRAQRREVARGR